MHYNPDFIKSLFGDAAWTQMSSFLSLILMLAHYSPNCCRWTSCVKTAGQSQAAGRAESERGTRVKEYKHPRVRKMSDIYMTTSTRSGVIWLLLAVQTDADIVRKVQGWWGIWPYINTCENLMFLSPLKPTFVNTSAAETLLLFATRARQRNPWSDSLVVGWSTYMRGAHGSLNRHVTSAG